MSEWLPSTVLYRPWLWCEEKLWKLFAGIRFQSLPVASSLSWMVVGQHPSGIATADGTIKTSSLTGCENRNAYPHIPNECLRWWRWWRCRRPVHLLDGRNHHLLLSQMNPQLLLLGVEAKLAKYLSQTTLPVGLDGKRGTTSIFRSKCNNNKPSMMLCIISIVDDANLYRILWQTERTELKRV